MYVKMFAEGISRIKTQKVSIVWKLVTIFVIMLLFTVNLTHAQTACYEPEPMPLDRCDFYQRNTNGQAQANDTDYVSWLADLETVESSAEVNIHQCKRRGRLQVDPPKSALKTHVYIGLSCAVGFAFHVGDSEDNSGFCESTSKWNAEIHNEGKHLFVGQSSKKSTCPSLYMNNYFAMPFHFTLHLTISHDGSGQVGIERLPEWPKNSMMLENQEFFEGDTFYIALNNMITGQDDRYGAGFCDLCILFE